MDLKYRIEKTKPYFVSFNVIAEESVAYAVAKFPSGWATPDGTAMAENFKVQIAPMQQGQVCFATEIENGSECIFDAMDYVIDFNKAVEERKALLHQKITELKNLFCSETLDRLKTLEFTFTPQKKGGKKTTTKKNAVPEELPVPEDPKSKVESEKKDAEMKEEKVPKVQESGLMALAKSMTEE